MPTSASAVAVTRIWWRLLAAALATLGAAAAFWSGFELGRARAGIVTEATLTALKNERDALVGELGSVSKALGDARQESVVLERSRRIERETNRSLQERLKQAQDERLALRKENSYLSRLLGEGGRRDIQVHELALTPNGPGRSYRYSFTLARLAADCAAPGGAVSLRIAGSKDGASTSLDLPVQPSGEPERFPARFDHIQRFRGDLTLPGGFEPSSVAVVIEPRGGAPALASESLAWPALEP